MSGLLRIPEFRGNRSVGAGVEIQPYIRTPQW